MTDDDNPSVLIDIDDPDAKEQLAQFIREGTRSDGHEAVDIIDELRELDDR